MTTIIAYILIAYAASATIVVAFALDSIGFWKQETLAAEEALQAARAEIDDDNVIIAGLHKLIGGHIKDNVVLQTLERYDERAELVPGEVADAVDAWLAGEGVTG